MDATKCVYFAHSVARVPRWLGVPITIVAPIFRHDIKRTNRNTSQPRRLNTVFEVEIPLRALPVNDVRQIRHLVSVLVIIKLIALYGAISIIQLVSYYRIWKTGKQT